METYTVELKTAKPGIKNRVATALICCCVAFAFMFLWSLISPTSRERTQGHATTAVESAFFALCLTATMFFADPLFRASIKLGDYKLLVEEDSMTRVVEGIGGFKRWTSRRTVRRGKVRTIFPLSGTVIRGIGVSERSRIGAWLWGYVLIPESLPEYERLKALVESWRASDAPDAGTNG